MAVKRRSISGYIKYIIIAAIIIIFFKPIASILKTFKDIFSGLASGFSDTSQALGDAVKSTVNVLTGKGTTVNNILTSTKKYNEQAIDYLDPVYFENYPSGKVKNSANLKAVAVAVSLKALLREKNFDRIKDILGTFKTGLQVSALAGIMRKEKSDLKIFLDVYMLGYMGKDEALNFISKIFSLPKE